VSESAELALLDEDLDMPPVLTHGPSIGDASGSIEIEFGRHTPHYDTGFDYHTRI
jgi:hypothetical protein